MLLKKSSGDMWLRGRTVHSLFESQLWKMVTHKIPGAKKKRSSRIPLEIEVIISNHLYAIRVVYEACIVLLLLYCKSKALLSLKK